MLAAILHEIARFYVVIGYLFLFESSLALR
jgi:hypothetical protein